MKTAFSKALSIALFLSVPLAGRAAETAYRALRMIGTQHGQDVLNRVIEVQGRGGAPQPSAWKITLSDPEARGGVREFEVSKNRVVAERTPARGTEGVATSPVMNFHKLNLDSEGAFTVAEKEAQKARLGFDTVNYTLRAGDTGAAAPVWVVQLNDGGRRTVGTMHIAADTGAVVRSDLYGRIGGRSGEDPVPEERSVRRERESDRGRSREGDRYRDPELAESRDLDRDSVYAEDSPRSSSRYPVRDRDREMYEDYESEEYAYDEEEPREGRGVKRRIKDAFRSAGATLEEFFTGKRTIDRGRGE